MKNSEKLQEIIQWNRVYAYAVTLADIITTRLFMNIGFTEKNNFSPIPLVPSMADLRNSGQSIEADAFAFFITTVALIMTHFLMGTKKNELNLLIILNILHSAVVVGNIGAYIFQKPY